MSDTNGSHDGARRTRRTSFDVRVLRQDGPGQPSYWERHRLQLEPDMNVTSVLQRIAAKAHTSDGEAGGPGGLRMRTAWKRSAAPARC